MKEDTKREIQEILRRVVSCAIPVRWRSGNPMPGAGERRSFYRGTGDEFDALEEYTPDDDPRDIDWNATAQSGGQVVYKNVYREARDLKVFVLADVRPAMRFGTVRAFKNTLSAELAAVVCKSAEETKDRVGYIVYSQSRVEKIRPTRAAKTALLPMLADIIETEPSQPQKGSGLVKALSSLPASRSLVFILSDFLRLNAEEKHALRRAALKHDVVCLIVQDRRERELPPGWGFLTIEDLETGERKTIFLSRRNRERFRANFQRHHDQLIAFLKEAHCRWLTVSTEEGDAAIPKIVGFFSRHTK